MRTVLIIVGGLILFGLCVLAARLLGDAASPTALAVKIFVPVWLVLALLNLWGGVARAGYTVAEELPIFCAVFAIPAAVALVVWWKVR